MQVYGCSETDAIKRLLVKHARHAFVSARRIEDEYRQLNYAEPPDYSKAIEEYDRFVDLLESFDLEIDYLPPDESTSLDSIYVHDPVVITDEGAILCNMSKAERQPETTALGTFLEDLGVPILGSIDGAGRLEGGDLVWLDARTLAVGEGYRTNAEGIRQLREVIGEGLDEISVVPLPHWAGPEGVFHLMSLISPVADDLAVVYSRLLSVPFRDWLLARGVRLVEVPDDEFETMACNVLAVAPRRCIMLDGNPITRRRLEAEGVEVAVYVGEEISKKGEGGPTCMTRPLLRVNGELEP